MNTNTEINITHCSACLDFLQTHPKDKIIHPEVPGKPWEVMGADMFHIHRKHYLCLVDITASSLS